MAQEDLRPLGQRDNLPRGGFPTDTRRAWTVLSVGRGAHSTGKQFTVLLVMQPLEDAHYLTIPPAWNGGICGDC